MITDIDQAVTRMRTDLVSGAFREWRERRGLTKVDAASRARVSRITLWRWETGRDIPSYEHALRLLQVIEDTDTPAGKPQASRRR